MNPFVRKATTRAAALAAGVLLAALAPGLMTSLGIAPAPSRVAFADSDSAGSGEPAAMEKATTRAASFRAPAAPSRSEEFRAAWVLLMRQPMDRFNRLATQKKLLAQWAEVDLSSAMQAVCGDSNLREMGEGFREAFTRRPMEAWKILISGHLGPNALSLQELWAQDNAKAEPQMVLSVLAEMTVSSRRRAISAVLEGGGNEDRRAMAVAAMRGLPDPVESAALQKLVYRFMDSPEDREVLRTQWSSLAAGSPERAWAMAAWASTLRGMDGAALSAQFAALPESDRAEAAKGLVSAITQDVPALLPALDQLIALGQWDFLDRSAAGKTQGSRRAGELAEWAMKLPDRPETRDLFYGMMATYLDQSPAAARAMLDALPEDDWRRQQAMVAADYSLLWRDRDLEAFNAKLATLTDPTAIRRAERLRYDYQLTFEKKITR